MNTVFIIGNGFDINLGMETRFSDFLEYYLWQPSPSKLIEELKEYIAKDSNNWSDLEFRFGRYTENLNSIDEFDQVYEDILNNLKEYLDIIVSYYPFKKEEKLLKYLTSPEDSFPPSDRNALSTFKSRWGNIQWNTYIITFNYTMSCEKLMGYTGSSIPLYKHGPHSTILHQIWHIHGSLSERMIMGVNDTSQISNKSFHDNIDILEALVKKESNKASKEMVEESCIKIINQANLICIFGSSIGETDNIWWEMIGDQLRNDCRLIIFHKGDDYPLHMPYKKRRDERRLKMSFLNRTKLTEEEKNAFIDKIYIAVNSDMFNIAQKDAIKINAIEPA